MKTLLFTLEYPPFYGGVANYYGNLIKYWPTSTETKNIFVLNNNDGRLINDKLPFLKWLPAYFALNKIIKQEKITHILVGHILPFGTATLIHSYFYKIKYSVILHGLDLSLALKKPRKKRLTYKILNRAEKIICVNSYTAEKLQKTFPSLKSKIIIVNPGVGSHATPDAQLLTQTRNKYQLNDKIILLSVGRLIKRKGFDKVIEAMPKILKQIPNLVYIIIGNGDEIENLRLKIKKLGIEKKIIIINQINDRERDSLYDSCDIFIMPSRNIDGDFEGFGIVYLEANLAGKPVIAGRSGGVSDAVIDGVNGLFVDPEDINQITAEVIKLAQNPELRKKLGEQGRDRALRDFNWKNQIYKIYDKIK